MGNTTDICIHCQESGPLVARVELTLEGRETVQCGLCRHCATLAEANPRHFQISMAPVMLSHLAKGTT